MDKKIHLSIPEPCHENWQTMTATEQGRFCNACQKQVVDFESMSDAQLLGFFRKRANEPVCGRFMDDQLNRDIQLPKKTMPWIRYFFQVAIPAFLVSAKVQAQGQVRVRDYSHAVSDTTKSKWEEVEMLSVAEKRYSLKGKLVDTEGRGIPYASVKIQDTHFGTVADSNGVFGLNYSCNKTQIRLLGSSVGYEEKEIIVFYDKQDPQLIFELSMKMQGEVVVSSSGVMGKLRGRVGGVVVREKRISVIDTVMNSFLSFDNTLKLYPNPAKANSSVSLSLEKPAEGAYYCQLLTLSGQFIFNRELWIEGETCMADIAIPTVRPGIYLLRLMHRSSKKMRARKIMIE